MKRVGTIIRETMTGRIKEGFDQNQNIFLMGYSNISSSEIGELRKSLKKLGAQLHVIRNKMAKRALDDLQFIDIGNVVKGQTAFVWSNADSVEVSKTLMDFSRKREGVIVKGGVLEGKTICENDIKRLSDLPSRDVLYAMVLGAIQSPLTRLASALNAKTKDLLSLLKQLSEKKGGK